MGGVLSEKDFWFKCRQRVVRDGVERTGFIVPYKLKTGEKQYLRIVKGPYKGSPIRVRVRMCDTGKILFCDMWKVFPDKEWVDRHYGKQIKEDARTAVRKPLSPSAVKRIKRLQSF